MPDERGVGAAAVPEAIASKPVSTRATARVQIVDVVRGLVMIVMVLDHTREFFTAFPGDPLDPQRTTPLLFFTRWITHLCAPGFVFLAGTSIFLQRQRKSQNELTRFLLMRGAWLILVELTLVHLVFNFNWQWNVQVLEVIWAIGASMIVTALLTRAGVRGTLIVGLLLICGHNAFDNVPPAVWGQLGWLWHLLHVPGMLTGAPVAPPIVVVAYPLLPWVGVMAIGYAWGPMLLKPMQQQRTFLLRAGTLMLVAFLLLRWTNFYGDPVPWTSHGVWWWRTLASFFNVRKYPPSLLFLLATLGVLALVTFGFTSLEARNQFGRLRHWLTVFGRVPFFFFLLHIALVHALALFICATTGGDWRWWITEFPHGGVIAGRPPGFGFGLATIWCIWIAVILLCYPVCKWYGQVKARSRRTWTSYL